MGAAHDRLTFSERVSIASTLLEGATLKGERKVGSVCPFHAESTKGGAFFYDAEDDYAFCYSCHQSGDLIDVYAAVKGLSPDDPDTFRAFWHDYAPDKLRKGCNGKSSEKPGLSASPASEGVDDADMRPPWTPMEACFSPDLADIGLWRAKATAFVDSCVGNMGYGSEPAQMMLRRWGLRWDIAARFSVGYNPETIFHPCREWGLPPEKNEKGRDKAVYMPKGYVFPVYDAGGKIQRIKIRLEEPRENEPRYMAVRGGAAGCYGVWGNPDTVRVWIVQETERDAITLFQDLEPYKIFGTMGIGTARLAPDALAHEQLKKAFLVINALDNDQAGATASWRFAQTHTRFSWNQIYPHCMRWPVPKRFGKDYGEMRGKLNAWDWIATALPLSMARYCEKLAVRTASLEDNHE